MKSETKKIKHVFTPDETAELQKQFHQAIKTVHAVESEFDSVKANYKAKTAEAQARADTLSTTIDAGFEMQDKKCLVLFRPKDRKKDYFFEADCANDKPKKDAEPALTEEMSDSDMQQELFDAEGKFDKRESIPLFPATNSDSGILTVGTQNEKWYGAIRANIGGRKIEERLDGEQPCCKKRADCVLKGVKRFSAWVVESCGKEVAKGFETGLDAVVEAHKERDE